jgi:hypothetical protein
MTKLRLISPSRGLRVFDCCIYAILGSVSIIVFPCVLFALAAGVGSLHCYVSFASTFFCYRSLGWGVILDSVCVLACCFLLAIRIGISFFGSRFRRVGARYTGACFISQVYTNSTSCLIIPCVSIGLHISEFVFHMFLYRHGMKLRLRNTA